MHIHIQLLMRPVHIDDDYLRTMYSEVCTINIIF